LLEKFFTESDEKLRESNIRHVPNRTGRTSIYSDGTARTVYARGETRKKLTSKFLIVFRAIHKCKASAEHSTGARASSRRAVFVEKKKGVKAKEDCREDFGRSNRRAGAALARRVRKLGFAV
jgi:hypothetical protein